MLRYFHLKPPTESNINIIYMVVFPLVHRFQNKPNRSVNLIVWIRAVLVEHVSYLTTVPELLRLLSDLYSTINVRLANHRRFLKLSGRLELLVVQVSQSLLV